MSADNRRKHPKSEAGSEAAEPTPGDRKPEVDKMYKKAAKDLADKGAADPKKAGEIAKKASGRDTKPGKSR